MVPTCIWRCVVELERLRAYKWLDVHPSLTLCCANSCVSWCRQRALMSDTGAEECVGAAGGLPAQVDT